jgi:hypothetical protein|tara:strand:+ start:2166 stop:3308 length:1143 start_codon:yes stop_codon:yes gene_type:complete
MPTSANQYFDTVLNWDGVGTTSGDYTDVTLEAQSSAGTAFTLFNTSAYYTYLGDANRFDMAIFDVASNGSLGALTWEYYNGSAWTAFTPLSGTYYTDPDDNPDIAYDFSRDGAEQFPVGRLSDWATVAINSTTKYWIRVTTASVDSAPTIRSIRKRALAAYCSTQDVFNLLQLKNVSTTDGSGTDFTASTTPTKATVEQYIEAAQSQIEYTSRKAWRPSYIHEEYHTFNLNGFKLDRAQGFKIFDLKIWNGASWDSKTQGRKNDYFFVPDTNMIQFSRYFLLPARFTSYNAPVWRWGGGEFTMPVKISYLHGSDIATDPREGGIVFDMARKLAAIEVLRDSDFGNLAVSGMDRVSMSEKISGWTQEVEDRLDSLRSFEVF